MLGSVKLVHPVLMRWEFYDSVRFHEKRTVRALGNESTTVAFDIGSVLSKVQETAATLAEESL